MPDIDRRERFYDRGRVRTMHIETDGAIVNITVGLYDNEGRKVTRVDVLPDDESRGGDAEGYIWRQDGQRVIRAREPGMRPFEGEDLAGNPISPGDV